uniref:Uncharacterized protein n=1 Tax=Calidris pygmaea TaxID=425635 RepID=A0A8C3JZD0_9CHAR
PTGLGSAGEDGGRCKVRDLLGGACLCQPLLQPPGESQRPHRQAAFLGGGEVLLSCERKYPSSVINVQTTEHHLKDGAAGSVGEMSRGPAVYSPALISVTLLVSLA